MIITTISTHTNKEEKLVLTNGRVVIPESYVSLSDFKVKEFQSKSFGSSHSLKLNEKFYQLTIEEQASSKGLALKDEIVKIEQLNQTFCLPSTTTDSELAKYFDVTLLSKEEVRRENNPLYTNKYLYALNTNHTISGFIKSNTMETIEMDCWSYKTEGYSGDKYLTRIMYERELLIEKNKELPTTEMDEKLIEDFRKYDLFCTLKSPHLKEGSAGRVSTTYDDSDKLEYFKKVYPSKTATTWDEAKSYLYDEIPWTPVVDSSFMKTETNERVFWDERYQCYYLKQGS